MCTTNSHSITRWAQDYDEDYLTLQHLQPLGMTHQTSTSVKSMFLAATSKWKYVIFAVSMFGFPYPLNILSFCCILDAKKKNDKVFLYFCHWIISYCYISHMVNLCLMTRNNAEVNDGLILSGCSLRVKAFCIQKDQECFRATLRALWPQRCLYLYLRLTIVIGLRRTGITDVTNLKI